MLFRRIYIFISRQISLYIGYYGTAKGGRTGHNPFACLPGAGWGIVDAGTVEIRPSYYPSGVKINYVVASRDGTYNVMLHWYQSAANSILASGWQQNIHRFRSRIVHNRNDGAYVQVNTFTQESQIADARETLKEFSLALLELLPAYWPLEG